LKHINVNLVLNGSLLVTWYLDHEIAKLPFSSSSQVLVKNTRGQATSPIMRCRRHYGPLG